MNYCPHCMRPAEGNFCPSCGGDLNWRAQVGQLPVGTLLASTSGRTYQIGAARGQGGFGITYVALDMDSHERVAVKEYFPVRCANRTQLNQVAPQPNQTTNYQGGLKSFLDEAKMLASVGALPSVVTVKDYFEANGSAYLVMEYLDGTPLHQIVNKQGRIPAEQLMSQLPALLRDLSKLHQAGVIHRDISPDNLMQMPDGTLKLLDFGSARSIQDGKSMTVLLKPGFSPVEQYRTKGQGPWTDVYALAATIYYCLTGVVPPTSVERLDNDTLQSPIALGAAITPEQETALLWALSVQPNARPATVDVFAQRLFPGKSKPSSKAKPGFTFGSKPDPAASGVPGSTSGPASGPTAGPSTGATSAPTSSAAPGQASHYTYTPNPKPAKKKTGLIIGIAAAVVVVLLIIIVAALGDSSSSYDPPAPTHRVTPTTSAPTSAPTPTPEPVTVTGKTDNGFTYQIVNGECAIITGYTGSSKYLSMPDNIDDIPITQIADNAFAGSSMSSCILPIHLETIGAGAFQNCSRLTNLMGFSDVETGDDSFSGCDSLRFLSLGSDDSPSGWVLPKSCLILNRKMDTGAGSAKAFKLGDHGEIYATTDNGTAVLMDVPSGTSSLSIPETISYAGESFPVKWVYEAALDHVSSSVTLYMSNEMEFPCELVNAANWMAKDDVTQYSHSFNWFLTCSLVYRINELRPSSAPEILPVSEYVLAAAVRAEELSQSFTSERPDGSSWSTLLNDMSIDWNWATFWRARIDTDDSDSFQTTLTNIIEDWAKPDSDFDNKYSTQMGAALYLAEDGSAYLACFSNIP